MPSPSLLERLTEEMDPAYALAVVRKVQEFVWECEADASSRNDWLRANALADLTEEMNR